MQPEFEMKRHPSKNLQTSPNRRARCMAASLMDRHPNCSSHRSPRSLTLLGIPLSTIFSNILSLVSTDLWVNKNQAWVLKKREERRLEAARMKFLRHLLGITKLDTEKNQSIKEKTGAPSTVKELKQYQKKWLQHVQRMDTNRLPKQALQYRPKGRRNTGRPR